jgi:hypothetical protein
VISSRFFDESINNFSKFVRLQTNQIDQMNRAWQAAEKLGLYTNDHIIFSMAPMSK